MAAAAAENATSEPAGVVLETDIPARLDRLPFGRFHVLVIVALGVTWILDGLEVTLAGALSGALKASPVLAFSNTEVGIASSAYLAGAVLGAMFFGWLTDRLGRKRLFSITLAVYLLAAAATATAWDIASFSVFRFLTGAGIGGEYAAINSTIQELIPGRMRGFTDLVINGSFWVGAAIGATGSIVLLNPALFGPDVGWRIAFLIGACLGLVILFMRMWIPESPRWLITHGRQREAQAAIGEIEQSFRRRGHDLDVLSPLARLRLRTRHHTPLREAMVTLFHSYRQRALVGLCLMSAQAFFYNAVLFTYGLVLLRYYRVAPEKLGLYLIPLALGNLFGPILIGRLFDTIGRKKMIAASWLPSL